MRKYLFTLIILGIIGESSGQENIAPLKFSLSEAQAYALENSRAVKNARIDLASADKRVWETIAMGLPQLGLSANYQHQFVVPELSFGSYLDPLALPDGYVTNTDILNAYKPGLPSLWEYPIILLLTLPFHSSFSAVNILLDFRQQKYSKRYL